MPALTSLYVALTALVIGILYALWRPVKRPHLIPPLFIPFLVFFVASVCLGGSALHDAATDYELYEAGRYYLCSHGDYTEVTHGIYLFMMILELVCFAFFGFGLGLTFVSAFRGDDD